MQGRAEEDNRRAGAIKGRQEFCFLRQGMTNTPVLFSVCVCFPVALPPNELQSKYVKGKVHRHVSLHPALSCDILRIFVEGVFVDDNQCMSDVCVVKHGLAGR